MISMVKDKEKLFEVLHRFEQSTLRQTGAGRIVGGFAEADVSEVTPETIYITLEWGIQSDCENTRHTEEWQLPLNVMNDESKDITDILLEIDC